jgi:UDP-N-acetylglucosamine 1-carboxyvinyltransferase
MQAGFLFAGALLGRFKEVNIPITSGCALGYRGPEGHIEYLGGLGGIEHTLSDTTVSFKLTEPITDERLVARNSLRYEERKVVYTQPKVTPTENVLLLLAKSSRYKTEISGIAQEPHVQGLIEMLREMGATITGKGSTIEVIGADKLRGVTVTAQPDHIDYFGCVVMAVMTKSDILLTMNGKLAPGIIVMNKFIEQMGIKIAVEGGNVRVFGSLSSYNPNDSFPRVKKFGHFMYAMKPGPWPAFPVDGLPSFIALSTMSNDLTTSTFVNNWMYEDGLRYVPVIKKMGANISYCDDQIVVIDGTESGNPFEKENCIVVDSPEVIEGTRAISYCGMAGGNHVINNAQYILRRSPEFFELHKRLGAHIEIFEPSTGSIEGGLA